jgi:type IV pilus assembly protein PilC
MVVAFIVVAGIMAVVVLPNLAPIFEESGVELPFFTRMILHSGDFLKRWWWFILGGGVGIGFVLTDYFRSGEGRAVLDEVSLRVPGIGSLLRYTYGARFSESVSVLLKGGIPAAQALEITGQTVGSVVYRDLLQQIALDVRKGELISQAIGKHEKYFPTMVGQMVAIGESTGRLESMLKRVSDYYMREVDSAVNNLVELIQPLLIVVIGILVGLLFASILKPIYSLVGSFA